MRRDGEAAKDGACAALGQADEHVPTLRRRVVVRGEKGAVLLAVLVREPHVRAARKDDVEKGALDVVKRQVRLWRRGNIVHQRPDVGEACTEIAVSFARADEHPLSYLDLVGERGRLVLREHEPPLALLEGRGTFEKTLEAPEAKARLNPAAVKARSTFGVACETKRWTFFMASHRFCRSPMPAEAEASAATTLAQSSTRQCGRSRARAA
eukprot:343983-Pleurochrysis_carterae.AAC.2